MNTLQKKLRKISMQQMSNLYGGKTMRIYFYDENGELRYKDVRID